MSATRLCQRCRTPVTPEDRAADFYTDLCRSCWSAWVDEYREACPDDEIPARYGAAPNVCTACGQGFGGVNGFDAHRHGWSKGGCCRGPAEIGRAGRYKIAGGFWIRIIRRTPAAWMPLEGCANAISGDLGAGEYPWRGSVQKTPEIATPDWAAS